MSQVIATNIDEAIARIDDWAGKEISYEPVAGGITNPNYKVTVDGTSYFLKIPGAGTDFIDRDNCHAANQIASDANVGAKVYYYFADTGVEVFEWMDGRRTTVLGDMYNKDICMAAIRAIRDFNNYPATLPVEESIFDQARDMLARCQEGDYIPPWHKTMWYWMDRIEGAFKTAGMESKPCHNDYWFNNFMWSDEKGDGKIIDIEYASMNEPIFDVALWLQGFATEDIMRDAIIEYNYGEYDEKKFAKLNLARMACEIKWIYWALQQAVNSNVAFDYYNWYTGKADRLRYYMVDNRLDYWCNTLEGRNSWRTPGIWKK